MPTSRIYEYCEPFVRQGKRRGDITRSRSIRRWGRVEMTRGLSTKTSKAIQEERQEWDNVIVAFDIPATTFKVRPQEPGEALGQCTVRRNSAGHTNPRAAAWRGRRWHAPRHDEQLRRPRKARKTPRECEQLSTAPYPTLARPELSNHGQHQRPQYASGCTSNGPLCGNWTTCLKWWLVVGNSGDVGGSGEVGHGDAVDDSAEVGEIVIQ